MLRQLASTFLGSQGQRGPRNLGKILVRAGKRQDHRVLDHVVKPVAQHAGFAEDPLELLSERLLVRVVELRKLENRVRQPAPAKPVFKRSRRVASRDAGTIDWIPRFPDRNIETAYSRLVEANDRKCIFSFVLMAPTVPMERLEGTLEQQSAVLRKELDMLQQSLRKS